MCGESWMKRFLPFSLQSITRKSRFDIVMMCSCDSPDLSWLTDHGWPIKKGHLLYSTQLDAYDSVVVNGRKVPPLKTRSTVRKSIPQIQREAQSHHRLTTWKVVVSNRDDQGTGPEPMVILLLGYRGKVFVSRYKSPPNELNITIADNSIYVNGKKKKRL
jgi:hypothetical protein